MCDSNLCFFLENDRITGRVAAVIGWNQRISWQTPSPRVRFLCRTEERLRIIVCSCFQDWCAICVCAICFLALVITNIPRICLANDFDFLIKRNVKIFVIALGALWWLHVWCQHCCAKFFCKQFSTDLILANIACNIPSIALVELRFPLEYFFNKQSFVDEAPNIVGKWNSQRKLWIRFRSSKKSNGIRWRYYGSELLKHLFKMGLYADCLIWNWTPLSGSMLANVCTGFSRGLA